MMINFILSLFASDFIVGIVKSLKSNPETWAYRSLTKEQLADYISVADIDITMFIQVFHASNNFQLLLADGALGKKASVAVYEHGNPPILGKVDNLLLVRAIEEFVSTQTEISEGTGGAIQS
jgi:hypothetical protein